MKPFTLLGTVVFALGASAGGAPGIYAPAKEIQWGQLPLCAQDLFQREILNGVWPLDQKPITDRHWCPGSTAKRFGGDDDVWANYGKRLDACKLRYCPSVDEWFDIMEWQWKLCEGYSAQPTGVHWINNYRESSWYPWMARPEPGNGWIQGVGGSKPSWSY